MIPVLLAALTEFGTAACVDLEQAGSRPNARLGQVSTQARESVIFLHHSVGTGFITQGHLRELLAAQGYELWDHGYNDEGLTRADGQSAGFSFSLPYDNTDPDGLEAIVEQTPDPDSADLSSPPTNAVSGLLRYDVIVLKSCFPASGITSDARLQAYQRAYLRIRWFADTHPGHAFVLLSTPPLEPNSTRPSDAARARSFARWLTSGDFLDGHPNVLTFDLFDALAEPDPNRADYNTLRQQYRIRDEASPRALVKEILRPVLLRMGRGAADSHPNTLANETIAPQLADVIDAAAKTVRARRHL